MAYPHGTLPTKVTVQPTPVYETWRWASAPGSSGSCATGCGPAASSRSTSIYAGTERFLVEFLRRNTRDSLGLTTAQLESLAMMAVGLIWIAIVVRRHGGIGRPAARRLSRCPAARCLSGRIGTMACARVLERSTTKGLGGMSPVGTEQQDGPSARTVSALVDDAAERLAAAGIDTSREDAEAIVADVLGVKPRSSRSKVESLRRGGRRHRGEGAAPGRTRAARLRARPGAVPRPRDRRRRARAVAAPGDRAAGRGGDETAAGRPRPRGRHRLRGDRAGADVGASRPRRSPRRTSRRRRPKRPARTPSGWASTSTSRSPKACPTTSARSTW